MEQAIDHGTDKHGEDFYLHVQAFPTTRARQRATGESTGPTYAEVYGVQDPFSTGETPAVPSDPEEARARARSVPRTTTRAAPRSWTPGRVPRPRLRAGPAPTGSRRARRQTEPGPLAGPGSGRVRGQRSGARLRWRSERTPGCVEERKDALAAPGRAGQPVARQAAQTPKISTVWSSENPCGWRPARPSSRRPGPRSPRCPRSAAHQVVVVVLGAAAVAPRRCRCAARRPRRRRPAPAACGRPWSSPMPSPAPAQLLVDLLGGAEVVEPVEQRRHRRALAGGAQRPATGACAAAVIAAPPRRARRRRRRCARGGRRRAR